MSAFVDEHHAEPSANARKGNQWTPSHREQHEPGDEEHRPVNIYVSASNLGDARKPVDLNGQWNSDELGHEEQMITQNRSVPVSSWDSDQGNEEEMAHPTFLAALTPDDPPPMPCTTAFLPGETLTDWFDQRRKDAAHTCQYRSR